MQYAEDPGDDWHWRRAVGAKGINVAGVCCTSNEVAMRHGIPMAGNFLQQENVVLTGACEAIVVDVPVYLPRTWPVKQVLPHEVHHHFRYRAACQILTSSTSTVRMQARTRRQIVKMAVENFVNRKQDLVHIPDIKQKATVGYSCRGNCQGLDGVTNSSHVDVAGTTKAAGRVC